MPSLVFDTSASAIVADSTPAQPVVPNAPAVPAIEFDPAVPFDVEPNRPIGNVDSATSEPASDGPTSDAGEPPLATDAVVADPVANPFSEAERFILERSNLSFSFGSAAINAEGKEALERVAAIMVNHPEERIVIRGHADAVGPVEINEVLSQARADSLKAALIGRGVDASRITAAGFGSTRPLASNASVAGRKKNRRAEFAPASSAEPVSYTG